MERLQRPAPTAAILGRSWPILVRHTLEKLAMRLALPLILIVLAAAPASARQYRVNSGGRAQVAHTRLAPVVMHRALPPFKGEHVYAGRGR
jgi:hypothetical protein